MQVHCYLSVTSAALYRYGLHYNVLFEMMMSLLQEVKGLTKKLYFIILALGRPVSMQNFSPKLLQLLSYASS